MRSFLLAMVTVFAAVAWTGRAESAGTNAIVFGLNGARLQFSRVTYGTNDGLPFELNSPDGREWARMEYEQGGDLILWFNRLSNDPTPSRNRQYMYSRVFVLDKTRSRAGYDEYASFHDLPNWSFYRIRLLPRQSQTVTFEIYGFGRTVTNLLWALSITNPAFGNFPDWKAGILPMANSEGNLTVRIDKIRGFLEDRNFPQKTKPINDISDTYARTQIDYSLFVPGGRTNIWMLDTARVSDSTGNMIESWGTSHAQPDVLRATNSWLRERVVMQGALWTNTSAWRVELGFIKTGEFLPGEMIIMSNIPLPTIPRFQNPAERSSSILSNIPQIPSPQKSNTVATDGISASSAGTNFSPAWSFPLWTNRVGGFEVVLAEIFDSAAAMWEARPVDPSLLRIESKDASADWVVDIRDVTINTYSNGVVKCRRDSRGDGFSLRGESTKGGSFNLTYTLQKRVKLEFFVPPPGP